MNVNKRRLFKLAKLIETHPKNYDQNKWSGLTSKVTTAKRTEPSCGSAACIAGHAAVMAGYNVVWHEAIPLGETKGQHVAIVAKEYLGILGLSFDLFDSQPYTELGWPRDYVIAWDDACSKRDRAKVAASLLRAIARGEVT